MWSKKKVLFGAAIIWGISVLGIFLFFGYSNMEKNGIKLVDRMPADTILANRMTEEIAYGSREANGIKTEQIAAVYCAVYEEAMRTNTAGSLKMMRNMLAELGKRGYVAVDSENQVDMVNSELVIRFHEAVVAGEAAELTIVVPTYFCSLVKYDFETKKGEVKVARGYYQYENGMMRNRSTAVYSADVWRYTEEGYLFFQGSYYTEESYVLVCSDEPEYAAFRVEPLAEKCRELNRKYILPVGYGANKLFLIDWSEDDFAGIDFYDMFDALYEAVNGKSSPYVMASNPNVGIKYGIAEAEFEGVILQYFKINREMLRSRTAYSSENGTYEYRPRGFYELGYSNIPYPEVVGYEEKQDGTLELIVNAVFPYENTAKAYSHKVVVRPLSDGSFQYVSNAMLAPKDYPIWWYSERLTETEWEEIYGKEEKQAALFP